MKCFEFLFITCTFLSLNQFSLVKCIISDQRLCVDEKCSVPISEAQTRIIYNSDDSRILSFEPGAKATVYSKSAGSRPDLWGAEIKGKQGYVPKNLLKETKIFEKNPTIIVPTETSGVNVSETESIEKSQSETKFPVIKDPFVLSGVSADDVPPDIKPQQTNYEVVDGTTLYNDPSTPTTPESVPEITSATTAETPPLSGNVGKIEEGVMQTVDEKVPKDDNQKLVIDKSSEEDATVEEGGLEDGNTVIDKPEASLVLAVAKTETGVDNDQPNLFKNVLDIVGFSGDNKQESGKERPKRNNLPEDLKVDSIDEFKRSVISKINDNDLASDRASESHQDIFKLRHGSSTDEKVDSSKRKVFDTETTASTESEITPTLEMSPSSPINLKTKNYNQKTAPVFNKLNAQARNILPSQNQDKKSSEQSIESIVEPKIENNADSTNEEPVDGSKNISIGETDKIIENKTLKEINVPENTKDFIPDNSNVNSSNSLEDNNASEELSELHNNEAPKSIEDEINQKSSENTEDNLSIHNLSIDNVSNEALLSNVESSVDNNGSITSETTNQELPKEDDLSASTFNEIILSSESETVEAGIEFSPEKLQNEEDNLLDLKPAIVNAPEIDPEMVTVQNTTESESVTEIPDQQDAEVVETESGTSTSQINDIDAVTESVEEVEELNISEEKVVYDVGEQDKSDERELTEEEQEGIFSWVTSLFTGSEVPANQIDEVSNVVISRQEDIVENTWRQPNYAKEYDEESCSMSGLGDDNCPKLVQEVKPDIWTATKSLNADFFMMASVTMLEKIPLTTALLLVITSIVVLIFTLGYYYIENHRRDGSLVARINSLERDLLIKKKENAILEDAFTNSQCEMKSRGTDLSEMIERNEEMTLELEELRTIRAELEEQVTSLEKELEAVADSGLEMHSLYESLSSQDSSQALLQRVESLREKLDQQDAQITVLNQSLLEKNEEIEGLQIQLCKVEEDNKTINERFNKLKREKEEESFEIKEKHRTLVMQLEELAETKALDESRTNVEMSKLRISLEDAQHKLLEREAEVESMKDTIRKLRATEQDEQLQELYDVATVQAKLTTAVTERDEFREKFIEEEGARKLLEDHVRVISREVAELKQNFETAEKEKIEALTKLKVLSNYFKEKETELQKEIGTQESLWLQKQGDDHTIYEQMRSLREENEKYRLQNDSLKKEICEQESSFKIQLANVEQKAHEHWVTSRQTERRLKELQQEAAQLRNRLTLSEKNSVNHDDQKKMNESNGDPSSPPPSLMFSPTTSPPFMMYHGIPPGDFIPPPPLISPYAPDSRPPPLGRISSPPLDPRFSPPPPTMPYPPYDYPYGHHTPSPPPPLPHRTVHKPLPRDAGREKDTVTNYSQDSMEKPSRRSKR